MKHQVQLGILLFFNVFILNAQEGNYRFNNFGNRSILLAGNVTGSVSDLGLTYYNPSFLTNADNVGFSLNAKAYQLVDIKLENVLNKDSQLSSSRFNGASTMAGGIFNLFGTKFAYSYLTKSNSNVDLNYSSYYLNNNILTLFPDAERHQARIGLNSKTKDDWTGLTWAYKINDKFSLGVSAFASIYNYRGSSDLSHTVESTNNEVAFYQNTTSFRQKSYGMFIKVGANYKFESFDLGMNVNIPYIEVYGKGEYSYSEVVAGLSSEYDKFVDNYFDDLSAKRKEPLGLSIGAGIPIKKSKVYLNVDYVSGLGQYDRIEIPDISIGEDELTPVNFDEERKAVFNFGIGAEYYISEQFKAYGGFSTDFSAYKNSANIFDLSSEENKSVNIGEDFYHFSLGIDWKLSWASLIMGFTHTNSSGSFLSPYTLNADGYDIENNLNASVRYTRWQFVVGIDVPILGKKVSNLMKKNKEEGNE